MTDRDVHARKRTETYRRCAGNDPSDGNDYKGLKIHALPGLHEFIGRRAEELANRSGALLDLAAGTGAMSLRLSDAGFDVTAADMVPENFRLHDRIRFQSLDLDDSFAGSLGRTFDTIMAVELIEHLENPRHFLRECFAALKPGGLLIVTTPNVNSPVSKALFMRFGTLAWFTDADYEGSGHITPVSRWVLTKCAVEAGFVIERLETFGDPFAGGWVWPKLTLLAKVVQRLSTEPAGLDGVVLVANLRKPG